MKLHKLSNDPWDLGGIHSFTVTAEIDIKKQHHIKHNIQQL